MLPTHNNNGLAGLLLSIMQIQCSIKIQLCSVMEQVPGWSDWNTLIVNMNLSPCHISTVTLGEDQITENVERLTNSNDSKLI